MIDIISRFLVCSSVTIQHLLDKTSHYATPQIKLKLSSIVCRILFKECVGTSLKKSYRKFFAKSNRDHAKLHYIELILALLIEIVLVLLIAVCARSTMVLPAEFSACFSLMCVRRLTSGLGQDTVKCTLFPHALQTGRRLSAGSFVPFRLRSGVLSRSAGVNAACCRSETVTDARLTGLACCPSHNLMYRCPRLRKKCKTSSNTPKSPRKNTG